MVSGWSRPTFARGLFRIPLRGGGPTTPQISFGNWGHFPEMDYSGIDDAVEIWWDPDVTVDDERGIEGQGAWRRSNGGERFTPSDTPATNPFNGPGSALTVVEELTGDEIPPDYPSPPGSPAAGS